MDPKGKVFWLTALFTISVTGQITHVEPPAIQPEFLAALENITVPQGRDVHFTCVVNHLSTYKVAWIKSDSKGILAIHTHMVALNPRLSVTYNGHNTWKLHVANVQANDSGTYMCQINTDPMRSLSGNLRVVIPPDILNEEEGGGGEAREGGSVRLRCAATGEPPPTVIWKRDGGKPIILRHDGRDKKAVVSWEGSVLHLSNVQRSDMGYYYCIASNGVPPSVSKRYLVQVQFHPLIKVSNQLVAAPVDSDVVVQCYVEASPRAMNSWYRDNGEKLLYNTKFIMTETVINDYSLYMNLTIKKLERKDFGGYVCASVNALGKVEGSVRLQELQLPSKPSTSGTPSKTSSSGKHHNGNKHNNNKQQQQHKNRKNSNNGRGGSDPYSTKSWMEDADLDNSIASNTPWVNEASSKAFRKWKVILLTVAIFIIM